MSALRENYSPDDPREVADFLQDIMALWMDRMAGPAKAKRAVELLAKSGGSNLELLQRTHQLIERYHPEAGGVPVLPFFVFAGQAGTVTDTLSKLRRLLGTYIRRGTV